MIGDGCSGSPSRPTKEEDKGYHSCTPFCAEHTGHELGGGAREEQEWEGESRRDIERPRGGMEPTEVFMECINTRSHYGLERLVRL